MEACMKTDDQDEDVRPSPQQRGMWSDVNGRDLRYRHQVFPLLQKSKF